MPIVARVTRSQPNQELENFELTSAEFGQVKSIIEGVSDPGNNAEYQVTIQPGDYTGITGIDVPPWVNVVILPGAEFTSGAFVGETTNVVDLNRLTGGSFTFPDDVTITGKLTVQNDSGTGDTSIFEKSLEIQDDLTVQGTIFANTVVETSSLVHKKDINPLKDQHLAKIKEMVPVEFTWKDTNKQDIGFIAEHVETVYPEFVERDPDTGKVIGIKYSKLTTVLIQSVKELNEKVDQLESKFMK